MNHENIELKIKRLENKKRGLTFPKDFLQNILKERKE